MSKLDLCSCIPVERVNEKADVRGFRDRIAMIIFSTLLMVIPAGCASQRAAAIAPPKPPASASPAKSGKGEREKPSGATLDMRNEKGEQENSVLKEEDGKSADKEDEAWKKELDRLRYDRDYYQKCYDNWECDQV